MSEELGSQDEANEDGNLQLKKVVKFQAHETCKDFKFKVGMQFSSLNQFKEAIMEH